MKRWFSFLVQPQNVLTGIAVVLLSSLFYSFFSTTQHHLKLGCPSTSSSQPDGTFLNQELGMNTSEVHGGAAVRLDLIRGSDVCFLCSTCSRLPARHIRQQRERRRWHASCWCTVGPAALGKAKRFQFSPRSLREKQRDPSLPEWLRNSVTGCAFHV